MQRLWAITVVKADHDHGSLKQTVRFSSEIHHLSWADEEQKQMESIFVLTHRVGPWLGRKFVTDDIASWICLMYELLMKPIYSWCNLKCKMSDDGHLGLFTQEISQLHKRFCQLTYLWHVGDTLYTADIYSFTRDQPQFRSRSRPNEILAPLQPHTSNSSVCGNVATWAAYRSHPNS